MLSDEIKYVLVQIKRVLTSRLLPLALIFIAFFAVLIIRLFSLQIIHGDEYVVNYLMKTKKTLTVNATRGNIYDCNGNLLAYNELTYSCIIEDCGYYENSSIKNSELNEIIVKMYNILDKFNEKYAIDYSIILNQHGKYEYAISGNTLLRYLRDIYGHQYISELTPEERNATASDTIEFIKKKYGITEEYSAEDVIKIIYIRSNLAANSYKRYVSFTVANDISTVTMASILENSDVLTGVTVKNEYKRCYNYGTYIAHLIGYTGKISQDELEQLSLVNSSYASSDIVGKSGIEKSYETILAGQKGSRTVLVDNVGRVLSVEQEIQPITGSDVYLTIDVNLTMKIYDLLERRLSEILVSRISPNDSPKVATGEGEQLVIPIKEVYNALFENNTLSIADIKEKHVTPASEAVYEAYSAKRDTITDIIYSELYDTPTVYNNLQPEIQEHIKNIRTILINGGILNTDNMSSSDELYIKWKNGEISLRDYLYEAIANDWINIYNLDVYDEYPTMDEVLNASLKYAMDELKKNDVFDKLCLKYLIKANNISGRSICLLLMEQNVVEYTEEEYNAMSGAASPYDYLISKIKDLSITPAMLALDPCSGAVVLENAKSGEIISMVTYPSYDINNFSGTIDSTYYASLLADKSTPLVNRTTSTRIAPGSTFKICTSIAGLNEGVITANERIEDTGIFDKVNPNVKCWFYPQKHGWIDVKEAIGYSCNYFFCEIGYRFALAEDGTLHGDRTLSILKKYAEELGLATKTGIEIAESTPNASDVSAIASTIGQGNHAYTALNLARYTATIGNGGTVYNSSLIKKVIDSNGDIIELFNPVIANQANYQQYIWDTVYEGGRNVIMKSAVGTDLFEKYLPVTVAGKSGTAQENLSRGDHANYITWAPYKDADVAVAVMIPNGYAAVNAGIMSYYTLSAYYDSYIPDAVYADPEGMLTIINPEEDKVHE